MKLTVMIGSLAAAAMMSCAVQAATVVQVDESGEGGGAMSLSIDTPTVKAGTVTFEVENKAMTEDHEMVLVKLKSRDQTLPLNKAKHRLNEAKLKSLGEVTDLKPGNTGTLTVNLKPGAYLLFCNIRGHYEAGMKGFLTVTN